MFLLTIDKERIYIMGNRAFITHKDSPIGIYLRWCGDFDSIKPLLDYCKLAFPESKGFTSGGSGIAEFSTAVMNLCEDSVLIQAHNGEDSDPGDNGIYYVDGWNIVSRTRPTDEQNDHDEYWEMMTEINESQSQNIKVPEGVLHSVEADLDNLNVGDTVYHYVWDYDLIRSVWKETKVFGETVVKGQVLPVIDYYKNNDNALRTSEIINPNNIISEDKISRLRVAR